MVGGTGFCNWVSPGFFGGSSGVESRVTWVRLPNIRVVSLSYTLAMPCCTKWSQQHCLCCAEGCQANRRLGHAMQLVNPSLHVPVSALCSTFWKLPICPLDPPPTPPCTDTHDFGTMSMILRGSITVAPLCHKEISYDLKRILQKGFAYQQFLANISVHV